MPYDLSLLNDVRMSVQIECSEYILSESAIVSEHLSPMPYYVQCLYCFSVCILDIYINY